MPIRKTGESVCKAGRVGHLGVANRFEIQTKIQNVLVVFFRVYCVVVDGLIT